MQKLDKGLKCYNCGQVYPIGPVDYSDCCFAPLVPSYKLYQDSEALRKLITSGPNNLFRYLPLLPNNKYPASDENIGMTELVRADSIADLIGMERGYLFVKRDIGQLTRTFKDRGVAVAVQCMLEFNEGGYTFNALGGSTTGNLGGAIAAKATHLGLQSYIFVYNQAPEHLVKKIMANGGTVLRIDGDYTVTNKISGFVLDHFDKFKSQIAGINLTFRPLYSQGSKTVSFEIAEQMGWNAPDAIVHPLAVGLSFWKIYEGLCELSAQGLIKKFNTRMYGAQPSNCSPIINAWRNRDKEDIEKTKLVGIENPTSVAGTLCAGSPGNYIEVLKVMLASRGGGASVSEKAILEIGDLMEQYSDIRCGPVGWTVVAAARKLVKRGSIKPKDKTVLVLTDGHEDGNYDGDCNGRLIDLPADNNVVAKTLEQLLQG